MASKKAKVSLPPLLFPVTDVIQSEEIRSPLTPLRTDLDSDSEELITAPSQRQSDFYWRRYAAQSFRLPGEPEDALAGPLYPGRFYMFTTKHRAYTCLTEKEEDVVQIKLTDATKKLIQVVSEDIIRTWPLYPSPENASKNTLLLVNPYAFVTQAFKPKLQPKVNEALNLQVNSSDRDSVPLKLQKLLEVGSRSSFRPGAFPIFLSFRVHLLQMRPLQKRSYRLSYSRWRGRRSTNNLSTVTRRVAEVTRAHSKNSILGVQNTLLFI